VKKIFACDSETPALGCRVDFAHPAHATATAPAWRGCAGKMSLDGSVAQRLDQLDKRQTELLKKIDDQAQLVKKLKDDRAYYRSKCDEKE